MDRFFPFARSHRLEITALERILIHNELLCPPVALFGWKRGRVINTFHREGCDRAGEGNSAPKEIRQTEIDLERQVSKTIGAMRILWIAVEDESGLQSLRSVIERNSIGLLSNLSHLGAPIDPASQSWLGLQSPHSSVSGSGLWNVNHTEDSYDPGFLKLFRELAATTKA